MMPTRMFLTRAVRFGVALWVQLAPIYRSFCLTPQSRGETRKSLGFCDGTATPSGKEEPVVGIIEHKMPNRW